MVVDSVFRLSIFYKDTRRYLTWWDNFLFYADNKCSKLATGLEINSYLADYNASINPHNIHYIEFTNEEDATAFVLRWS